MRAGGGGQAAVSPNRRSAHAPGSTSPTRGRRQKQEEPQSYSLRNREHKHGKLESMSQLRNMFQTKKPGIKPQNNEVETGNLPGEEFSVIRVKMTHDLNKRMVAQTEDTRNI